MLRSLFKCNNFTSSLRKIDLFIAFIVSANKHVLGDGATGLCMLTTLGCILVSLLLAALVLAALKELETHNPFIEK